MIPLTETHPKKGESNMGNRMNEAVRSNISYYPVRQEVEVPKKPSWVLRATNWLGVTMAHTENPRGQWSFSPAVITLSLVILSMVAGGAYYMGQRDNENRNLMERIQKVEEDSRRASQLAAAAAGQAGHTNTNTKPK